MSNARLFLAYGHEIGVGQAYGRPMYGTIGFGITTVPGFPLFSAPSLDEISEGVTARVTEAWAVPMYGTLNVRQAKVPGPAEFFSIQPGRTMSPEFVEDELLEVSLRLSENETRAFEFDEYAWQD